MEQQELEKLIEELESRVDRLRVLYEQYFMGLERVVPATAHKDVERRLAVMRRQTIRNTGLRFRFQNTLLKYNTYSTYWMRITRQIEEGTYKRDIRRAKARFGVVDPSERGRARARGRGPEAGDDLELDVDVEFEADPPAELATFEDEEIAKAHEEVAKMRAALQQSRALRAAAAAPPAAPVEALAPPGADLPPPRARMDSVEPATEPKLAAAKAAKPAGGTYAVRGGQRPSNLPPSLPIAGLDSVPPPARGGPLPNRGSSRPPAPRPGPAKAAPQAGAARPVPRPRASAPRLAGPPDSLSDERVRQIYTQLVETKRKVGESTAAITFESLSRSLRDSSEKLKQKHAGKNVDFEVTVKDGKAVLRPVVK